ncbi:unnamed protein product [Spodoptera exigua]|nr:unnamed protein product [Spodoptera exigua]
MPFYHKPREFTPLLIAAQKKSIKNGLRHAIFTSRGDKYIGDWKNDVKEGKGRFLTAGGKLYEGDWVKGCRHGFGLLSQRQENGTFKLIYRGEWAHGYPEGSGWMYYDSGDTYMGFFKRGMRHGYGNMWYKDGTFFAGYFYKNMRHGIGLFLQADGNRYEGHFENDLKSGYGRFYHMMTGQIQEGCWENDVCVMSKMSDMLVRQACERPTPYPIPVVELKFPKLVLEHSEFWMKQKTGEYDKNIKKCIDQM